MEHCLTPWCVLLIFHHDCERICNATAFAALPHASTSDDEYDGYFIPKGTIVMANTWYERLMLV